MRELIRKDGTVTEKLRPKAFGKQFEPVNAFQVKGALANVDDRREGIKNKAELSIPSFKSDIYSQEDERCRKQRCQQVFATQIRQIATGPRTHSNLPDLCRTDP